MSTKKHLGFKSIAKSITAGLWMFLASKSVSATETDAIGRVDMAEGEVFVIRNGEKIALGKDDPILQGDTILTGADGSVGVTFIDDTVFSLGADGEMTIDEMVYDADKQEGKFAANMVTGVFSFISGEISKTDPDGMSINTPVGTIGIRGTKVAGVAAAEGTENSVSLLPETSKDGQTIIGEVVLTNASGSVVLNQVGATVQLSSSNQVPPTPVVLSTQQIQQSYGKTLTTLSSTVLAKATNDAVAAEQEVVEKEQVAEEAKVAAEEAQKVAEETGDKEAIAEAEKLAEVAEEAIAEVEVAKEVVEEIKEVVEIAKQEFEVQKEAFKEFVADEKPEDKLQEQEKPEDAEKGDDAEEQPNEEGREPEEDVQQDAVAPEGPPIEDEGEEMLEGEPEVLEGDGEPEVLEGEKPPEKALLLEEAPPENVKPQEQEVVEDAPAEVIAEEKPQEQVVEAAAEPVLEQPKPQVMEAPQKPIYIAPIVVAAQPMMYQEVVEEVKFIPRAAPPKVQEVSEKVSETVEEETIRPNLLNVGDTGDTISSTLNVGYYSVSNGIGVTKQVNAIETAGHTAIKMTTLSATELTTVDMLWVINPSNGGYANEFTNAYDDLEYAVKTNGLVMIMHDRAVGSAENVLFGEEPANIVRGWHSSKAIEVIDHTTVLAEGPGGILTDNSLDNGSSSSHGYTYIDTLPESDSLALLTNAYSNEAVDFAYKYGEGAVIYSTIPLDFYLSSSLVPDMKNIYAPNMIQFGASLLLDGYKTLQGTNNADIVVGTANDDVLEGRDGNDTLFGLFGDDILNGGAGADILNGGSGRDVYIFNSLSDSPAGFGDTIKDFNGTNDKIDISNITTTFNLVSSFTGNTSTHEVVYNASTKLMQMDANGDRAADMEVTLENYTGSFDEGTYSSSVSGVWSLESGGY